MVTPLQDSAQATVLDRACSQSLPAMTDSPTGDPVVVSSCQSPDSTEAMALDNTLPRQADKTSAIVGETTIRLVYLPCSKA
jgi:hypothetical protein